MIILEEASRDRAVSDSWTMKLLSCMLLSLTVQELLKQKNKALHKGSTCATQWVSGFWGFFLLALRAKVKYHLPGFFKSSHSPQKWVHFRLGLPLRALLQKQCYLLVPHTEAWKSSVPLGRRSLEWEGPVLHCFCNCFRQIKMEMSWCWGCFETEQVGTMLCACCWAVLIVA